jgi:hypothetical protein
MQAIKGGPGRGHYLISSVDSKQLSDFIASAGDDPALQLIEIIGPQDSPHTAIYDMPHDSAAELARRFQTSGNLKIEPDRPLSLFDSQIL